MRKEGWKNDFQPGEELIKNKRKDKTLEEV